MGRPAESKVPTVSGAERVSRTARQRALRYTQAECLRNSAHEKGPQLGAFFRACHSAWALAALCSRAVSTQTPREVPSQQLRLGFEPPQPSLQLVNTSHQMSGTSKKAATMKIVSVALLSSGIAILLAAAALAFQGGIIADSTGGVGGITPVETVMWVVAPVLASLGLVLLFVRPRIKK